MSKDLNVEAVEGLLYSAGAYRIGVIPEGADEEVTITFSRHAWRDLLLLTRTEDVLR